MTIYNCIYNSIKKHTKTFVVTFIIGFITHAYMFTNMLPIHDTVQCFFEFGATLDSGRWGLEILSHILPQCNIPWLNGLTTLIFISASVCLIIEIFEVKIPVLQYLLGGLIITFPSLTGTFTFMFTSACYGLAIFLFSIAALLITKKGRVNYITALICFVFSLSIYQAYLFFMTSLLLVYLIKCSFENESHTYKKVLKYILFLLLSPVVYFAINFLFMTYFDVQYNGYVDEKLGQPWSLTYIIKEIIHTYSYFADEILKNRFRVVISKISRIIHVVMIMSGLILSMKILRKNKRSIITFLICLILLPISINIISIIDGINTMTIYSFVVIYILFAVIIQQAENNSIIRLPEKSDIKLSRLAVIPMILIISLNIVGANKLYIKLDFANRNAESFYTGLVTQIKSNPDFKEGTKIALIGKAGNTIWGMEEFSDVKIRGHRTSKLLINMDPKKEYIKYFIGFNVDFASDEEIEEIINLPEFAEMAEYPYYNSVKAIDDYIVVKFSDVKK